MSSNTKAFEDKMKSAVEHLERELKTVRAGRANPGVLDKLRSLSDQECMDLIRKVQAEYHLPEKARTIGEMLAEARQRSGAQKLSGHDIMALERFDPATRHMIVFDVLTHDSPVGWKGEKMRLFLTDAGYSKALENQEKGHIKVRSHAKVLSGDLHYDHKDRER